MPLLMPPILGCSIRFMRLKHVFVFFVYSLFQIQLVMLGETFTGKTSLVLRFAEGYYRESSRNPTVGAFFITKRLTVQGMTAKIQIWDTAGQEQFKKLAPMYYKSAAAAIVCYDVTSPKSFETLECK